MEWILHHMVKFSRNCNQNTYPSADVGNFFEEPLPEIEHLLDSAQKCVENITHKDSGAGANASSSAGMVLIATSPLSELVWSPDRGLSLRHAGSSLAEKKASVLWNAESFNIIISSPQYVNDGTRDPSVGLVDKMQLELNAEDASSKKLSLIHSPRSTADVHSVSPSRSQEQDSRSRGDIDIVNKLEEVSNDELKDNQKLKEEVGTCSSSSDKVRGVNSVEKDEVDDNVIHYKISSPDNNCPSPESSNSREGLKPDVASKELPCAAKKQVGTKNCQPSRSAVISAYENSMTKDVTKVRSASSSSADQNRADLVLDINLNCGEYSDDEQSKKMENRTNFGAVAASQSLDVCQEENLEANNKDNPPISEYLAAYNSKPTDHKKCKEKVLYDDEDGGNIAKEREGSHESVESSTSKRLTLKRKRAQNSSLEAPFGSKRFQNDAGESSYSGTLLRKDSSFLHWISTITNSLSMSYKSTPVPLVQKSSSAAKVNSDSPATSHNNDKEITCATVGFNSLFQSLSRPSVKISSKNHLEKLKVATQECGHCSHHIASDRLKIGSNSFTPVTIKDMDSCSKKVHVNSGTSAIGSLHVVSDHEDGNLKNQFVVSDGKLNQNIHEVEELPLSRFNGSTSKSASLEKEENGIGQTRGLRKMGSSSSSNKDGSGSHAEKGIEVLGSVRQSSSTLANDSSSGFLGSLWITRLFPKVLSTLQESVPCSPTSDLADEKLNGTINMLSSSSKENAASNMEHNSPDNCCLVYLESEKYHQSRGKQSYPISPTERRDQKLKSRLSPIQPSQNFKKSETIASHFAKRLDALRHIKPSCSNNVSNEVTICFFCGRTGHNLKECSDIVNSNLEGFPENKSCSVTDGCILCSQRKHRGIACRHASLKGKNNNTTSSSTCNVSHVQTEKNPVTSTSPSYDGRIILWSVDKKKDQQHASVFPQGGLIQKYKPVIHTASSTGKLVTPCANVADSNPVREDLAESSLEGHQMASDSMENLSKGNQIVSYYNILPNKVSGEPTAIFGTLRKLRLSRMDIIRWLKSPIANVTLKGFFLRLRLGKWEGFGGTGYNVACINGATCKNRLSVCIGNFTCLVDCRFVSNHDFLEDELKAWWSAVMRGDIKLPSREELNKKLQEMELLDFK
ncbi:uncharacterized protein [Typha angustifolia]|uniref:uncharacterized protein isoform X1 n=3 Tax=Typha angustifolia TaxID=59011 RepID=UPI003C2F0122